MDTRPDLTEFLLVAAAAGLALLGLIASYAG